MKIFKKIFKMRFFARLAAILCGLLAVTANSAIFAQTMPTSFSWTSTGAIISPKSDATHNMIAVKDPSTVFYNGQYIVYASSVNSAGNYGMEYLHFTNWSQAGAATPYFMDNTSGFSGYHTAPQLFYFAPQSKWYLIFQSGQPQYSTNSDPTQPQSWSTPKNFFASQPSSVSAWIDFWIISDSSNVYLFFCGDNGNFYRSSTSIANFPNGFNTPVIVYTDSEFNLFEADNVYYVEQTGTYLANIECIGSDGHRFFRALTATTLGGTWTALGNTASLNTPFLGAHNTTFQSGVSSWTDDFSSGGAVIDGYDSTDSINLNNLTFLYQGDNPNNGQSYNLIPWQLGLVTSKANTATTPTNTPVPATNTPTKTNTPVPPTLTPTKTNTPIPPTNTFTNTFTKTNTPVPPTNTFTNTFTKTNTPVPPTSTFTNTYTFTNTFTKTNTPVPPSATPTTPVPTNTSTNTALPTNTGTPIVPTATPTTPVPTNTPIVPTATPTTPVPTNTNTPIVPTATPTTPAPTNTNTPVPTATPTVFSGSGALTVYLLSAVTTNSTNSPHPQIEVVNTGTTALNLNNVEVRYWFNCDCTGQSVQTWVDWAGLIPAGTSETGNIQTKVVTTSLGGQTNYISYKFTGGLVLQAGQKIEIQSRFNLSDWSNMLQSNDWSFAAYTSFTTSSKTTGYINGALVWGNEPSSAASQTAQVSNVMSYPNPSTSATGATLAYSVSAPTGTGVSAAANGTADAVSIPVSGTIRVSIYTASGRMIWSKTLDDPSSISVGQHSIYWNGKAAGGQNLASGTYILKVSLLSNGGASNGYSTIIMFR
jgi:hypothetical protein